MSFFTLMIKNPFRNRTRTILAIIGIAIGIATIVALGMVTVGLQTATTNTLTPGAAEISVTQTGAQTFPATGGNINESIATSLQNISGIQATAGILSVYVYAPETARNSVLINGMDSSQLSLAGIESVNGTIYSNGDSHEIILGKSVAQLLNKTVGSTINIYGTDFKVTGTYETNNFITNLEAFTSLSTLQNLTNNNGKLSSIAVKVNNNANVTNVSKEIENAYPNQLTTTTAAAQANSINQSLGTINTASTAISLLAVIIGGIGIINVMIMSVFERTREFGVLKAVGWRSRRILIMVLGESIILTLTAAVVGTVMGYLGANVLLTVLPSTGAIIKPVLTGDILIRAFTIALIVGVLGGLYPAYRASRLPPTEALRYE